MGLSQKPELPTLPLSDRNFAKAALCRERLGDHPLGGQKQFSTTMGGINDLSATSPHGSYSEHDARKLGFTTDPSATRGTATAHRHTFDVTDRTIVAAPCWILASRRCWATVLRSTAELPLVWAARWPRMAGTSKHARPPLSRCRQKGRACGPNASREETKYILSWVDCLKNKEL